MFFWSSREGRVFNFYGTKNIHDIAVTCAVYLLCSVYKNVRLNVDTSR